MGERYIGQGILGISRALDSGLSPATERSWFSAHTACAVLAAYYFCRNNPVEPGVAEAIAREIDRLIERDHVLFIPYDTSTDVAMCGVDDILHSLKGHIGHFMYGGHNVIFCAYALQVLNEEPHLATPHVLNGIFQLSEYFRDKASRENPLVLSEEQQGLTPAYTSEEDMIERAFTLLECAPRMTNSSGQGRLWFNGHLMTHAHALVTLSQLGHTDLACQGYEAHRFHREWNRSVPVSFFTEAWAKEFSVTDHPFTLAFWNRDFTQFEGPWEFDTHEFKYLYSFYDLLPRIRDPHKRRACELQRAYLH